MLPKQITDEMKAALKKWYEELTNVEIQTDLDISTMPVKRADADTILQRANDKWGLSCSLHDGVDTIGIGALLLVVKLAAVSLHRTAAMPETIAA